MDNQLPAAPVSFVSVAGGTLDETTVSSTRTSLLESSNLESVYEDLRNLASWLIRSEKTALSLEEVDLVHESYLRLTKSSETLSFQSRKQLINLLVTTMRRVLIDHAKQKATEKRGGNLKKVSMEGIDLSDNRGGADQRQELLDLEAALDRLASIHSQGAQIVKLRIFAGLTFDEISELLGDSRSSIYRQWMVARAWLKAEVAPLTNADGAR
ncbi:MAG: ECF-type sigma factor [Planctomycetaceae bacterium]|nr:ECF-type sigma factor [Planctomycetaceae bacterium]